MIDLHSHSLLSDGVLIPAELANRAREYGYKCLAITDHVDASNLEAVCKQILTFCKSFKSNKNFTVLPGVEITHVDPSQIKSMTAKARKLGVKVVVCHGETMVEPVMKGTNLEAIKAKVDILAHPGFITKEECEMARKNNVMLEITSRQGHSLTNGYVASMAKKHDVKMILTSDTHVPGDFITLQKAENVALGAGLTKKDFQRIRENAKDFVLKVSK